MPEPTLVEIDMSRVDESEIFVLRSGPGYVAHVRPGGMPLMSSSADDARLLSLTQAGELLIEIEDRHGLHLAIERCAVRAGNWYRSPIREVVQPVRRRGILAWLTAWLPMD